MPFSGQKIVKNKQRVRKMTTFNDVAVVKKANIYFDGQVSSRTVRFKDGAEKTLGFMLSGNYTFNTSVKEIMEILAGELELLLPDTVQWKVIKAGDIFNVPENSAFKVNVKTPVDYCCSYL